MVSVTSNIFQNCKNKTAVKLTAVSCPPVVEVKIKRPDTKYQLGFSVQNGVVSWHIRDEQHFLNHFSFFRSAVYYVAALLSGEG